MNVGILNGPRETWTRSRVGAAYRVQHCVEIHVNSPQKYQALIQHRYLIHSSSERLSYSMRYLSDLSTIQIAPHQTRDWCSLSIKKASVDDYNLRTCVRERDLWSHIFYAGDI